MNDDDKALQRIADAITGACSVCGRSATCTCTVCAEAKRDPKRWAYKSVGIYYCALCLTPCSFTHWPGSYKDMIVSDGASQRVWKDKSDEQKRRTT